MRASESPTTACVERETIIGHASAGRRGRRGGRCMAPVVWRSGRGPSSGIMESGMRGKRVLIAGGTAGIGRAAAAGLARLGAAVTVLGRDAGRARDAAAA